MGSSLDKGLINSLPASGKFYCLLPSFAKSLDPDQAQHNVGSRPNIMSGLIWIQNGLTL